MKRHNHDIDIPDEIEFEREVIKKFIEEFETESDVDSLAYMREKYNL